MTEQNLDKDIERADMARFLLEHPLLVEAFEGIEATYTSAWRDSRPDEGAARERVYIALQVLASVRGHLESVVMGGALARRDIEDITGQKKGFSIFN
jgi:hypothetical protein